MLIANFTILVSEKSRSYFLNFINEIYPNNTIEEEEIINKNSSIYGKNYKISVLLKTRQKLGAFFSELFSILFNNILNVNFKFIIYNKDFINDIKFSSISDPYGYSDENQLKIDFTYLNKKLEYKTYTISWADKKYISHEIEKMLN